MRPYNRLVIEDIEYEAVRDGVTGQMYHKVDKDEEVFWVDKGDNYFSSYKTSSSLSTSWYICPVTPSLTASYSMPSITNLLQSLIFLSTSKTISVSPYLYPPFPYLSYMLYPYQYNLTQECRMSSITCSNDRWVKISNRYFGDRYADCRLSHVNTRDIVNTINSSPLTPLPLILSNDYEYDDFKEDQASVFKDNMEASRRAQGRFQIMCLPQNTVWQLWQ